MSSRYQDGNKEIKVIPYGQGYKAKLFINEQQVDWRYGITKEQAIERVRKENLITEYVSVIVVGASYV